MKRFIEIAIAALTVVYGAAAAHAQQPAPQLAELPPTVVAAPVHRTMAPPVFAIPVAKPPVLQAANVQPAMPTPAQPTPAQPTPVLGAPTEVAAPEVAPMHVTFSTPAAAQAAATPTAAALPVPPAPPVVLAQTAAPAAMPTNVVMSAPAPMPVVVTPPGYVAAAPVALPMVQAEPAGMTPITLEAGTGSLLHLPVAAATIMSAQPTIARVQPASPTSLFLMGVGPGRTTVIAASSNGTPIAQYDVTVTPGLSSGATPTAASKGPAPEPKVVTPALASAAQAAINQSVVGGQSVSARAAGQALLLTGTVATAQMAQSAVSIAQAYIGPKFKVNDQLSVLGSIQVNVRVRIAEIDRNITRQLGFNWQAFGNFGGGNSFQIGTPAMPTANLAGATFATASLLSGRWDFNGVIDALAQDNLITILAEPNLTAQSGETASFLAGGEFPIPVAAQSSNGQPTITIAFKQFGVSLALVPTVLSANRLNLRIRPEVSQLSTQGEVSVPLGTGTLTIPALSVRRAETTIELGSGQSFAIAGL
ncbi:MAG: pilus assembly protein N-terminal domain-containing protein, partial [Rhodospirillales bacterium]|nr:pilus assembly protein N-terminal domain-containing protein [Rhodospirillales bacterium]